MIIVYISHNFYTIFDIYISIDKYSLFIMIMIKNFFNSLFLILF